MESKTCQLTSLLAPILLVLLSHQANADCPADGRTWVPSGQNCYHFVHGEEDQAKSYTIDKAKHMCEGFALLTVRSADINKFIVEYSLQVWKGNVNVWLGMYYDSDDDAFKWNDETSVSYKNWVDGGSEWDVPPMDTCVALHSASGQWENVSCSEQQENGVVCETAQTAAETGKYKGSPLLSVLVIVSVLVILGISAVIWFVQQRNSTSSSMLPSFEYHPPFKSPSADETCLVEAEELEETS